MNYLSCKYCPYFDKDKQSCKIDYNDDLHFLYKGEALSSFIDFWKYLIYYYDIEEKV